MSEGIVLDVRRSPISVIQFRIGLFSGSSGYKGYDGLPPGFNGRPSESHGFPEAPRGFPTGSSECPNEF
eukprot:8272443-Pyramimonas_sp.AAC.1